MPLPEQRGHRAFVSAFARGLSVIEAFGGDAKRMSLSEVAARTRVDRAVARRLLLTLVELGYVISDGRHFQLTGKVMRLASSFLSAQGFDRATIQPQLDALSREIQENVSLSILEGDTVLSVLRSAAAARWMSFAVPVGTHLPVAVSVAGRMLLASLSDDQAAAILRATTLKAYTARTVVEVEALLEIIRAARRDGYVVVDQELEDGLLAVAVPLRDRAGQTVAAISASSHSGRTDRARMIADLVPRMQEHAQRISQLLS